MRVASGYRPWGRLLPAAAGVWGLPWVFKAWMDIDLLLALANGIYGCG